VTYRLPAPRSPQAHLELTDEVPVVVVDAPDWLDVCTAPGVEAVALEALRTRPERLAVDLSACRMADAYGVGALARVRDVAAAQGTELWLVGVNRRVRRVLDLVGLSQTLPVHARPSADAG